MSNVPPARYGPCEVAIVIKALNERNNIARSIRSAQRATAAVDGIVILADSGSTDGTVEIAQELSARVVQLADPAEKSCGIGAQLGFQHADCRYVYVLDGDMELCDDFLPIALDRLRTDPRLAGVGGLVEEHGEGNYEFERRKALQDGAMAGDVEALDMGGLYRADLVSQIGYLTNRNLHSYEEKELALRLRSVGYRLHRISRPAVRHYGKTAPTGQLLLARWRSRHLDGPGELLRAAFGRPYLGTVMRMFWRQLSVLAAWLAFLIALPLAAFVPWLPLIPVAYQVLLFLYFVARNGAVRPAGIAFLNLQVIAASLGRGLLRRQASPAAPIRSVILTTNTQTLSAGDRTL